MVKMILIIVFVGLTVLLVGCYYFLAEAPYIERARRNAEKYVSEHPELDETIRKAILKNEIVVGMSKKQIRSFIIGYRLPDVIRKSNEFGSDEMWIYKETWADELLYFKGDILIKIQKKSLTAPRGINPRLLEKR